MAPVPGRDCDVGRWGSSSFGVQVLKAAVKE